MPILKVWVPALLFLLAGPCASYELFGRVVAVVDGDTIEVLAPDKALWKVRISGIDAPEKRQPFGQRSKQLMSDLTFSKNVTVDWKKKDRYGRIIGKVLNREGDVGLAMISAGFAWHFKKYQNDQSPSDRLSYSRAEVAARASSVGLWRDSDPIPPWEFRKAKAPR